MGMNDPESAPSPKRFCSRLGIRTAALNASAASDCRPKKYEKIPTRTTPDRRLARIPAATIASARKTRRGRAATAGLPGTRTRFGTRQPLVRVRRLPGEPRHHQRVLLQVLLADALVEIDVGVVHADVVVLVLLDWIEPRNAGGAEAEMIGVADPGDDVAPRAGVRQRREPRVEQRFRRLAVLHVPPVNGAGCRIHIQVDERPVARLLVGVSLEVLLHVGFRSEQPFLFTAP